MKTSEDIARQVIDNFMKSARLMRLPCLIDLVAYFSDTIRQARIDALEEACKVVCSICHRGVTVRDYEGTMAHPMVSVDDGRTINWYCRCAAYEIRQLIAREKESKS